MPVLATAPSTSPSGSAGPSAPELWPLTANVIAVVGAFAWLGKAADGVFLAALLTVIGYSVNDSVVVFDRIRESWNARRGRPFAGLAGAAVLQTLPRTVNTGASTLLVLTALLLLGGDSLADFALALVLGIIVGTISTVSVAVPLTVLLEQTWPVPPPEPPAQHSRPASGTRRSDGAVV
jgi:SecD/SecF fusion protein